MHYKLKAGTKSLIRLSFLTKAGNCFIIPVFEHNKQQMKNHDVSPTYIYIFVPGSLEKGHNLYFTNIPDLSEIHLMYL